jgi:hypothetical protein
MRKNLLAFPLRKNQLRESVEALCVGMKIELGI